MQDLLSAPVRCYRLLTPWTKVAPDIEQRTAVQLWFAAASLDFCGIRAQRQPWLRNNYTAGAGYGNMNP
jgi:hypothetical protein